MTGVNTNDPENCVPRSAFRASGPVLGTGSASGISYSKRKFTSMVACTGTGLPSFMPGLKRHFSTASMAF